MNHEEQHLGLHLVIIFCPLKVSGSITRTQLFQFLMTHGCDTSMLVIQPTVKGLYSKAEGTIYLECACRWVSQLRASESVSVTARFLQFFFFQLPNK